MRTTSDHSDPSSAVTARRFWGLAGVLLMVVTACAPAESSGAPSAVPTGPLADVDFQKLPAVEDITFVAAAEAELELIAEMRADAGFAELLGPDGEAILEALDEASREHGETTLPVFVEELGVDLEAASLAIAAMPGAPNHGPPGRRTEWSGSLLGNVSGTISMTMALTTMLISRADESGSGELSRPETYTKNPTPTTHETIDITTTYRVQTGGGMVSIDVEIQSTDVITDANGAEIGRLEGTGHGHMEVNACPAADGTAEGSYTLEWQENLSSGGGAGSTSFSNTSPFTIWNGDDAHWQRIDTTMDLQRGASGAGTPSGDWSVEATVPMTIPASGRGRTVIGYEAGTVSSTNASATQVANTVHGTFGAQMYLVEVAKEAEKFWRSGKCIELQTSEESREVDPDEEISFSVEARHKFDGAQLTAPITATFSGKETLEPANTPMDPPANFDFTAGSNPGDRGTIELKQTSKRGIGLKTLTFTVAGSDLIVTYDGNMTVGNPGYAFNGTFVLADVRLQGAAGTYTGSGTVTIQGALTSGPCSVTINEELDATVTGTLDEADSNLARVRLDAPAGNQMVNFICPEGLTYPFAFYGVVTLWESSLRDDIEVPIDGSVTVPISGDAPGSTTITLERLDPSQ